MRKLKEMINAYFEWVQDADYRWEVTFRLTPLLAFIFLIIVLLILLSHFF